MPRGDIQNEANNVLRPLSFHLDWQKSEWGAIKSIPLDNQILSDSKYFNLEELIKEKELIDWLLIAYEAIFNFKDIKAGSFVLKSLKKDIEKSSTIQALIQYIIYLLHMQLYINRFEKRNEPASQSQLKKKIETYLDRLKLLQDAREFIEDPDAIVAGNYSQFHSLTAPIQWIKSQAVSFKLAKTTTIQRGLSKLHQKRLQLGGSNRLINIFLKQFPDNFYYVGPAKQLLKSVDPIFNSLTWQLLYARLGISLFQFCEHVIKGPWMSQEESNILLKERLKIQWHSRKYSIINDALWGTANLLSIFCLPGGQATQLLNAGTMLINLFICLWQWKEASNKQKTFNKRLEQRIVMLSFLMNVHTIRGIERNPREQDNYRSEQEVLSKILKDARLNWKAETYRYFLKLALSIAIMIGFGLVCAFVSPLSGPSTAAFILSLLGSLILHCTMIMGPIIQSILDRCLLKESFQEISARFGQPMIRVIDYSALFKDLVLAKYQEEMIHYKTIQIIHILVTKVLIPAVIVAALVFMPSGLAIATTIATLVLSHWSHTFSKKNFEPSVEKITEEAEKEFTENKVNILINRSKEIVTRNPGEAIYRFFSESIFKKPQALGGIIENERQEIVNRYG